MAMAKERVEYAKATGDEAQEDIAERQLDDAEEALERYEDRTMDSGGGGAIAGGSVLSATGVGAMALGVISSTRGGVESPASPDHGLGLGFAIGGVVFVASGVVVIVLGTRKGWIGPPDDGATAAVGVGPGSVTVHGSF
ncbi:MAG: hypothetical protein WKG00_10545 [Polyangiaceae bacterium]